MTAEANEEPMDDRQNLETVPREADLAAVDELAEARRTLLGEIEKRIVGQRSVVDSLLVALFARGHTLFVGVPGLAKTLLISTVAEALDLTFNRIQFTPDLMPSDITGTDVLEEDHTTGKRAFRFVPGPIFANLLLADHVVRYAVELVRATRPKEPGAPDFVKDYVAWGAGPRASQYLVLGAKSRAVLDGRVAASEEDVRALARRVLVHRVIANFRAESDGVSSRDVVDRLLEKVK